VKTRYFLSNSSCKKSLNRPYQAAFILSILVVVMKKIISFWLAAYLPVILLLTMGGLSGKAYGQGQPSPTPAYNPLKEPVIPEHPSDYELGRNYYWHYCMPCHGDKGQGLTDEWRAVWVPDHQDCWGRGCHSGKRVDDSFPIPTAVPPIVSSARLARFTSRETLYEYLKSTHPPQKPGCLTDEEYRAIAVFLFSENDRPAVEPTLPVTVTLQATFTHLPETVPGQTLSPQPGAVVYVGLGIIVLLLVVRWAWRRRR
jgi:hypothetical protein